jgi:GNAT superfamily N-acetyltransferase
MAELTIRAAAADDVPAIGTIAIAAGQEDDWSGRNPAYVQHLMRHARLLVAISGGRLAGFGATQRIGSGPAAVTMLCDLFVHPDAHGRGIGRALLAELWDPAARRMTFSSMHAHALPLYTSVGLDAWWPLLSLEGDGRSLRGPAGWEVAAAAPGQVAGLELGWTGTDRSADHRAWAGRPNGGGMLVTRDGVPVAAGTAAGPGRDYALMHLAINPAADDAEAAAAVTCALAGLAAPGPVTTVCLPGPHPAVRPLLASGWRVTYVDQFMASEPGLLDPRRAVPSPGQA